MQVHYGDSVGDNRSEVPTEMNFSAKAMGTEYHLGTGTGTTWYRYYQQTVHRYIWYLYRYRTSVRPVPNRRSHLSFF